MCPWKVSKLDQIYYCRSTKKLAAAKDLMEDYLDFNFLDQFQSDEMQAKKRDIRPRKIANDNQCMWNIIKY